jgi:hypothetical protein
MPVEELPIFSYFNVGRFTQFSSCDIANFYGVAMPDSKKEQALYPCMGRKHIESAGQNVLIFNEEPSQVFKTINFTYFIVGTQVIQVDQFYNQIVIGNVPFGSVNWFSFLPVGNVIYAILTAFVGIGSATNQMFLITETPGSPATVTMTQIVDANAPVNPLYVATFGNSITVSSANSPDFGVSAINLQGTALNGTVLGTASPFTVLGVAVANRSSGVIRQMCTLHNQLYMFNDFNTDIWSNIQTQTTVGNITRSFPFKLNSSYNWDYGMADPFSLDVDFGRMAWLAKNTSGLVTFMTSNGQQPQDMSTQAINVLLQNSTSTADMNPFLTDQVDGFLYQYENTIFYRVSAGDYVGYGELDVNLNDNAIALEFNFDTQRWGRVIELNGERNRIEKHVFFNNTHLVTVQGDPAVYEMAGNIYRNETRTPGTVAQDPNAFTKYPMRYELVTQQIFMPDYSEFITDYVEIDFVFGDQDFYKFQGPFANTTFIITEDQAPDGSPIFCIAEDVGPDGVSPVFLITEDGNTPGFDDIFYNTLFKPNISLYASDDGGVTFEYYDLREFSQLGMYRWKMRWYEMGTSRNRVYRLVCVSSAPIVILGAVQNRRRASGGAN